jgi:hypothetical protein
MSKKLDLGTPFKTQWAPTWHPKSTQWCPKALKSIWGAHFFAILKLTRFQKVARSARGFILYDLLYIVLPTRPQLYRFWKQFWHLLSHNVLAIAARHGTHGENLQKTSNSNAYQTLVAKHSTNAISKHSTNAISKNSMQNTC